MIKWRKKVDHYLFHFSNFKKASYFSYWMDFSGIFLNSRIVLISGGNVWWRPTANHLQEPFHCPNTQSDRWKTFNHRCPISTRYCPQRRPHQHCRGGPSKQVEGARGEGGGGGLSSSLARQQYLGFCNLFISPELAEQFHEQYSKGERDSQEHLFKAYVALRSATEVSALQAVENVCRSSIPSNLPSAARPNNRHVNGNYDLCSSEWTDNFVLSAFQRAAELHSFISMNQLVLVNLSNIRFSGPHFVPIWSPFLLLKIPISLKIR